MCRGSLRVGLLEPLERSRESLRCVGARLARQAHQLRHLFVRDVQLDAPRIETILVERPFSGVPHGAKGLGELPMDIPAPAVVAAIHHATGAWITDLPATPEKVIDALLAQERDGETAR